jgi:hypothetical protein
MARIDTDEMWTNQKNEIGFHHRGVEITEGRRQQALGNRRCAVASNQLSDRDGFGLELLSRALPAA